MLPSLRNIPRRAAQSRVWVSWRSFSSNQQIIQENDITLLRRRSAIDNRCYLTKPLKLGQGTHMTEGSILHESLIGKRVRDIVCTSTGVEFIVTFPTLSEYLTETPRRVTPIYPLDAANIVTMLDLHVDAREETNERPVEILEAGTGHGSLTLHLARAIRGAKGGAVLHTLDSVRENSEFAERVVKGFRRGMYSEGVKFYSEDIETWLKRELEVLSVSSTTESAVAEMVTESEGKTDTMTTTMTRENKSAFLTAVFLDLPSPTPILPLIGQATLPDAFVGFFAPSITQIADVVREVQINRLPFYVEKVVEFGNGVGGTLKQWDVRIAKVRSRERVAAISSLTSSSFPPPESIETGEGESVSAHTQAETKSPSIDNSVWETVCRPLVGISRGGGFYLVLRRMRDFTPEELASFVREREESIEKQKVKKVRRREQNVEKKQRKSAIAEAADNDREVVEAEEQVVPMQEVNAEGVVKESEEGKV